VIGLIAVGVMNKLDARKANKAADAAALAAQHAAEIAKDTHTLVNNNMGIALLRAWNQSKRIAELTAGTAGHAGNVAAAEEDERLYRKHMENQAIVDSKVRPK